MNRNTANANTTSPNIIDVFVLIPLIYASIESIITTKSVVIMIVPDSIIKNIGKI